MLDLHMPPPDGFEVMSLLRPWTQTAAPVPILVLTADILPETKRKALAHGARDFVTKPFDLDEVRLRTTNLLDTRRAQLALRRQAELLENRIRRRTQELDEARRDVLEALGRASEYRDDNTGEHTRRVGRTARLLADELGLGDATVDLIGLAAPLHDIGKIGIPDRILLKPGQLEPHETRLMRQHVMIGSQLLVGNGSEVLEMARRIVLTHHERWDGGGYPSGLAADAIPLEGRIVAIADVFDALTHTRPYKQAWSVERALETVLEDREGAFDPTVVDAFADLDHEALLAPTEPATAATELVGR
jgi:putative two-component system response regulator